jgi:hypothetical protein
LAQKKFVVEFETSVQYKTSVQYRYLFHPKRKKKENEDKYKIFKEIRQFQNSSISLMQKEYDNIGNSLTVYC